MTQLSRKHWPDNGATHIAHNADEAIAAITTMLEKGGFVYMEYGSREGRDFITLNGGNQATASFDARLMPVVVDNFSHVPNLLSFMVLDPGMTRYLKPPAAAKPAPEPG